MRRSLVSLSIVASLLPAPALACGGFFCAGAPMDQSKERIVFGLGEGEVEVHVQIFYAGEAHRFAWVVPVAGVPDVDLSSDAMFQVLDQATQPRFWLSWREEGQCNYDLYPPSLDEDFGTASPGGGALDDAAEGDNGVEVLAEGQTGPYDWKVVDASSEQALLTWLEDNDYDIPAAVGKALGGYLAGGSNFVAFKLNADADVGDIAPVRLTYPGDAAMIPIVLTSIAATPDMRLQPYVFADRRAVPSNYLHVQINEAAIDWLSGGSNYDDVITRAADEAGGQAFATDYSGNTDMLANTLYSPGRYDLARLRTLTDPVAYMNELLSQGFRGNAQLLALFQEHIPMPASLVEQGVDPRSFYNCLSCYGDALQGQAFDPGAMTDDLQERIVDPMIDGQALFDRYDVVTRLTSSMSPEEMTIDPTFVLNGDMADVSNVHEADLVVDCTTEPDVTKAPRRIELGDGRIVEVPPESWMWSHPGEPWYDEDAPAAELIEKTGPSGQPEPVRDQSGEAQGSLDDHNRWVGTLRGDGAVGDDTLDVAGCEGGGCAQGGSRGMLALLGGVGLLGLRRRR